MSKSGYIIMPVIMGIVSWALYKSCYLVVCHLHLALNYTIVSVLFTDFNKTAEFLTLCCKICAHPRAVCSP